MTDGEEKALGLILERLRHASELAMGLANTERHGAPDWSREVMELRKQMERVLVDVESVVTALGRIRNQATRLNNMALSYERDVSGQLSMLTEGLSKGIRELEEAVPWKST